MMSEAESCEERGCAAAKRPYRLGQRGTSADETRTRVLAAARTLILEGNGFGEFSMESVARYSGVTRVTVYHHFKSKRGLLEALFDEIGARSRLGVSIPDALSRPNLGDAITAYIAVFCDFWSEERDLNRRLRGFATVDAEFAAAIASRQQRRHQSVLVLVNRAAGPEGSAGVDKSELVQNVLALTGFEFYDVLAGQDRNPQQVASIVTRLVLGELRIVEA